ncbi:hypothetical protein OAV71_04725 [Opitutales bacterium]|nr:hypothetical protein [Opitutales bacterium]
MKLPLGCIHFNSDLSEQGGTPSWGQELGQSVGYLMTREGCTDILHGMIQNQIMDHNNFVFGRTRSINSHVTKLLAIFKETVVQIYSIENDSSTEHRMDSDLILMLQQESGNSHEGRKTIKFNRGFEYLENKNEDFYDEIVSKVDSSNPIFSYSIHYNIQANELILTFIAAPSGESPYENSQLRGDIWNDYIKKYEINTGLGLKEEQSTMTGATVSLGKLSSAFNNSLKNAGVVISENTYRGNTSVSESKDSVDGSSEEQLVESLEIDSEQESPVSTGNEEEGEGGPTKEQMNQSPESSVTSE